MLKHITRPCLIALSVLAFSSLAVASCGARQTASQLGHDMVSCTSGELKSTAEQLHGTFDAVIDRATGADGHVDTGALKSTFGALKDRALQCAAMTAIGFAISHVRLSGAAQSSGHEADSDELRALTRELKSGYGVSAFETPAGRL